MLRQRFGRLVYDARQVANNDEPETQEVFGARLNWSQKRVSLVEGGAVPLTLALIEEVADGLGVRVWDLIAPLYDPPATPEEWSAMTTAMARATIGVVLSAETMAFQQQAARPDARAIVAALATLPTERVRELRRHIDAVAYSHQQGDPDPERTFPPNLLPSPPEEAPT